MLFPRGKEPELLTFLFRGCCGGKMKCGCRPFSGLRVPNLMFPGLTAFQERVDTGTPLFCPVVVASKGSSLNHSA
jgi:hypothetical protein